MSDIHRKALLYHFGRSVSHGIHFDFFYSPLAAAITANGFLSAAAKEISETSIRGALLEDIEIVENSLHFVDDFLRSMLDVYRSKASKLEVRLGPTDILKDVFEPILHILRRRDSGIQVLVDCPEDLIVMTDCLRLKQVRDVSNESHTEWKCLTRHL